MNKIFLSFKHKLKKNKQKGVVVDRVFINTEHQFTRKTTFKIL